jgi:uncharacterized surface protein with fasciclin (FAS1) repeats
MKNLTLIILAAFAALMFSTVASAQCGSGSKSASYGSATDKAMKSEMKSEKMDIIETAVSAGSFETLATAIKAAGLVEALKGDGPFTVFAPTDEAFAALPEGTLESLLNDKEALTAILTYHVVPGELKAGDVVKLSKLESLQGQDIEVKLDGKKVMVSDAEIKSTDILCSNGVIHVIDRVILPEMGE